MGKKATKKTFEMIGRIAHPIFVRNKWKWARGIMFAELDRYRIPSKKDITSTVSSLYKSAAMHKECATGRFTVKRNKHREVIELEKLILWQNGKFMVGIPRKPRKPKPIIRNEVNIHEVI